MENRKVVFANLVLLGISIIWGAIYQLITKNSLLSLFTKDYFNWIISLKYLLNNTFYYGILNKLLFLIKTGYYLIFTIAIIWLIIIGINYLISKKSEKIFQRPFAETKPKNELDELINKCNDKLEIKNIEEAKNIYRQIKEKAKDKNYSKEQYERIIELYKKLAA